MIPAKRTYLLLLFGIAIAPTVAVIRGIPSRTRRALVVLITEIVDITASAELLAAIGRLTPRYLPFCVTLGDR